MWQLITRYLTFLYLSLSSLQPPFYSRNTAEMYDNILNKPLQLKPNITNSARHLLEGLLQKDRTKRLGAKEDFVSVSLGSLGEGVRKKRLDYASRLQLPLSELIWFPFPQQMEIKNHIFFSPINWDDLINKKITPPFNPNVVRIAANYRTFELLFIF